METKLTRFSYVIKKSDLTEDDIDAVKAELTVKPFKLGSYGKFAADDSFSLFVETEDYLGIPRFFGIEKFGLPTINKLEAYAYPEFDMVYKGELREQQTMIVNKVIAGFKTHSGGLLIAGCGIGKTNMAIYLACKFRLKTLFIVHKGFLMQQFVNRVKAFTNVKDVGIIQQKKVETDHPFVVAMLQSLAKRDYPDELFKDFGLIIIDEVHHMASRCFSKVFKKMTAKYMLGISAESQRTDKLYKVINWYMGPFLHIEPQKPNEMVIVKRFNYATNNEERIKMVINRYTKEPDRSTMITNLTHIKKRNRLMKFIIEELYDQNKHILCLTGRLKQIDLLFRLLNDNPLVQNNVGKYIGSMKKEALEKSAKKQIILATYDMASEGLDIPDLNVVLLMTPKSSIRQSVGRILRKDAYTENPLIVDFIDGNKIFSNQANTRYKYFAEQKYHIQDFNIWDFEHKGIEHKMWNDTEYIRECLLEMPNVYQAVKQVERFATVDLGAVGFDDSE